MLGVISLGDTDLANRKLTKHTKVKEYFKLLSEASPEKL